jgi:arylsulfatase A-like enzyme
MPPNVLVLVFDTARADAFEPYGAPGGTSPAVGQLAERGAAVEDVFSTACWTLPSHASMFTGMEPRALGLGQAPGGVPQGAKPVLAAQRERLLPEVLRRAGYDTRAASANLWVSEESGFAEGFEQFVSVTSERQTEMDRSDRRHRMKWALAALRPHVDDGAGEIGDVLARWIADAGRRPFFWFVNLVECHSPYLPPAPYNDLAPLDRLRAAREARLYLNIRSIWRTCLTSFEPPGDAVERMKHLYARSVRLLDDWLARILEALDDRQLLDETLVIVTSDHGENLGEGGLIGHAFSLDDRLIRVPFVVSRRDFALGGGAKSLMSLPSMLAEYLDLADHPWNEDNVPAGLANAQFDFVEPDDPRVKTVASTGRLDSAALARMTTPLTCVTDGRLKLLRRGDADELYDLRTDPLELSPAVDGITDGDTLEPLKVALEDPRLWVQGDAEAVTAPADEIAELEGRMKLLGYM